MKHLATIGFSAFAAGWAASHWLDPDAGRARRARAADRAARTLRIAREDLRKSARDLANRARGTAYEAAARLRTGDSETRVLEARAKSELGFLCSHPRALSVHADDGRLVVEGPVLAGEAETVLAGLARVRGVREVVDRLERHDRADVSSLQGGRMRARAAGWRNRDLTPAARLLVAATGLATAALAIRRRSSFGMAAGLAALTAFARRREGGEPAGDPSRGDAAPTPSAGSGKPRLTLAPG